MLSGHDAPSHRVTLWFSDSLNSFAVHLTGQWYAAVSC